MLPKNLHLLEYDYMNKNTIILGELRERNNQFSKLEVNP